MKGQIDYREVDLPRFSIFCLGRKSRYAIKAAKSNSAAFLHAGPISGGAATATIKSALDIRISTNASLSMPW